MVLKGNMSDDDFFFLNKTKLCATQLLFKIGSNIYRMSFILKYLPTCVSVSIRMSSRASPMVKFLPLVKDEGVEAPK